MPDFRTHLYERYVSTFKGSDPREAPDGVKSFFAWCDKRYLPLLEDIPRDEPVLEIGCGPGLMLEYLRSHGFRSLEGIDLSEEQIEIAKAHGLDARTADVFEFLESAKERYAAILAIDFVEHFSKEELMRLVPNIQGALRPGGHLILQTPNGGGLLPHSVVYGDLTHLTIFTPNSLTQLLRLWGFDEFRFSETGPVAKNVKGRLRSLAWAAARQCANAIRIAETGAGQDIWTANMICRCVKSSGQGFEHR